MNCQEIKELIEKEVGIDDISRRTKLRHFVDARCIFYYSCVKYADDIVTFSKLGTYVNKKHCTVLFGYNKFQDFYHTDLEFKLLANSIIKKVKEKSNKKSIRNFDRIDNFECSTLKKKLKNIQIKLRVQTELKRQYKKQLMELKSIQIN